MWNSDNSPAIEDFSDGIDDVEEFDCVNEGESSMKQERFQMLVEFVTTGNQAFRRGRFKEISQAINCYSKATCLKPDDPTILSNRCAAYIRLSRFLRSQEPSASESSPLYGLDPTTHAELALKDAEKVMSCRNNSVKSYILQADALFLLERYEQARDAVIAGLQLDPLCTHLQALFSILKRTCTRLVHGRKPERSDEFDCTLCLKLLFEPITTPCGHSFCRSCLFQSMDRNNKCPLCRTVLFITPRTCAISVTLNNIIQRNFAEEYAERKSENDNLVKLGADLIPLFVMDVVLPCQKLLLNIFEPRYRLMVRRIMEGNHRMGMVTLDSTTGYIADLACEVEITECEALPDGRFHIEVEGRRRFRIRQSWNQDGYRVAVVEWIHDNQPEETRENKEVQRKELQELTSKAADYAKLWIMKAKDAARQDQNRSAEIHNLEAMMPTKEDPERFSFWLTTLTKKRPSEQLELLRLRNTKERMHRGLIYLNQGCRMQ